MKTIRSKLKLLSAAILSLAFITFFVVSLYTMSSLSKEFGAVLGEIGQEQSSRMRADSERVKDRFLDFYESAARKKGESLLDKDVLILQDAYMSNSYSGVIEYLKKSFDFDPEISVAAFFILEDGQIQAWQYLTRQFPNGLGLGLQYDLKKKMWLKRSDSSSQSIPDARVQEIVTSNERQVTRAYLDVRDLAGKSKTIPALEVVSPITDDPKRSVEDARKSGEPIAFLYYIISIEKMNQEFEREEKDLAQKLAEQAKRDQETKERTAQTIQENKVKIVFILICAGLLVFVLVQLTTGYFARRISSPLEVLADAAESIAKGHYEQSVSVISDDEVGKLARSFETMRVKVKEFTNNLQDLVTQRTERLEQTLKLVTIEKKKIQLILDQIEQGIVIFGSDLKLEAEYSRFAEKIFPDLASKIGTEDLETILFNNSYLSLEARSLAFQPLIASIGASKLNWDVNAEHLIKRLKYKNSQGREMTLELHWSPIVDDNDEVDKVLLAIKDLTDQIAREEKIKAESERLSQLIVILSELLKQKDRSVAVVRSALMTVSGLKWPRFA